MKILWWPVSAMLFFGIMRCHQPQVVKSPEPSQGTGGLTSPQSTQTGTATTTPSTGTAPPFKSDTGAMRGGSISPNLGVDQMRLDSFKREQAKIKAQTRQRRNN